MLSLVLLGASRAQLTYGDVTIAKGADSSIVPRAWAPKVGDPDQAGVVVFEGAVFDEDTDQVLLELLFWLQAPRCRVSSFFGPNPNPGRLHMPHCRLLAQRCNEQIDITDK